MSLSSLTCSLSSLSSLSNEDLATNCKNDKNLDAYDKYDDLEFRKQFHLSKKTVVYIESLIGKNIKPLTKRNRPIQPQDQILVAFKYFATGGYQKTIASSFNVEQSSVHRIVHRVSAEIAKLKGRFITMPTLEEGVQIADEYFAIAGFPKVIGSVGCTHVKIISPGKSEADTFRNSEGFFSLNVQMVCDAQLRIRHISESWPGSACDSSIFDRSTLCVQFEQGDFGELALLGNVGYPFRNYLLTPILNPVTPSEGTYNWAQNRTRNIEKLFKILKGRFPCLQQGFHLKVNNIPPIIIACAVLHNIAILKNDMWDDDNGENNFKEQCPNIHQELHCARDYFLAKHSIIKRHFNL